MRILISAPAYPTEKTPFAAFISVVAHEFSKQGHEITVIAPQSLTTHWRHKTPLAPIKYSEWIEDKEIKIYRPLSFTLGQGRLYKISNKIDQIAVNFTLHNIKTKFDVIYSHFWWCAYNVIPFVKRNKLPLVVVSGEDKIDIHNILSKKQIADIRDNTRGVIGVSTKNIRESIELGLLGDCPNIMLPNSIDSNLFYVFDATKQRNKLGIKENDFVVAFCGRFSNRKGINRLDQALCELRNPRIKAIYIGSPSEGENIKIKYPGVVFCGKLPHEDIPQYLNCSDVFVLPSLAEGCSNSIVEAMACGLPIISSDLPFNYDILTEKNSILINPLDIQELKNAINRLANNSDLSIKMGKSSAVLASDLNIQKRVGRIIDFVKKLL